MKNPHNSPPYRLPHAVRYASPRIAGATLASLALIGAAPNAISQADTAPPTLVEASAAPPVVITSLPQEKSPVRLIGHKLKFPTTAIYYSDAPAGFTKGNATDGATVTDSGITQKDRLKHIWRLAFIVHSGQVKDPDCGWIRKDQLEQGRRRGDIHYRFLKNICKDQIGKMGVGGHPVKKDSCRHHHHCSGATEAKLRPGCRQLIGLNLDDKTGLEYQELSNYNLKRIGRFGIRYRVYGYKDHRKAWGMVHLTLPSGKKVIIWGPLPDHCVIGNPKSDNAPINNFEFSATAKPILSLF